MLNLLGLGEYSAVTPVYMYMDTDFLTIQWAGVSNAVACGEAPPDPCIIPRAPVRLTVSVFDCWKYIESLPARCADLALDVPYSFMCVVSEKRGQTFRMTNSRALLLHKSIVWAVCASVRRCGTDIESLPLSVSATELSTLATLYGISTPQQVFPLITESINRTQRVKPGATIPEGATCTDIPSSKFTYPFSDCADGCSPSGPWLEAQIITSSGEPLYRVTPPPPRTAGLWRVSYQAESWHRCLVQTSASDCGWLPYTCEFGVQDSVDRQPIPPMGPVQPVPGTTNFRSNDLFNVSLVGLNSALHPGRIRCNTCGDCFQFPNGYTLNLGVNDAGNVRYFINQGQGDNAFRTSATLYLEGSTDNGATWFPMGQISGASPVPPAAPATDGLCEFEVDIYLSLTAKVPFVITINGFESEFEYEVTFPRVKVMTDSFRADCGISLIATPVASLASNGISYALNFAFGKVLTYFFPVTGAIISKLLSWSVDFDVHVVP